MDTRFQVITGQLGARRHGLRVDPVPVAPGLAARAHLAQGLVAVREPVDLAGTRGGMRGPAGEPAAALPIAARLPGDLAQPGALHLAPVAQGDRHGPHRVALLRGVGDERELGGQLRHGAPRQRDRAQRIAHHQRIGAGEGGREHAVGEAQRGDQEQHRDADQIDRALLDDQVDRPAEAEQQHDDPAEHGPRAAVDGGLVGEVDLVRAGGRGHDLDSASPAGHGSTRRPATVRQRRVAVSGAELRSGERLRRVWIRAR